jgi:polar amino acid transport system permease protein
MPADMQNPPAQRETAAPAGSDPIKAIKLRHPWRMVVAVVLVAALALFVWDAALRPAYDWPEYAKYIFDRRIAAAAWVTIQLTVYSMIIAILLLLLLAGMRLSPNPVVKSVAWLYLWIFRGTPVYVQLVFWGLISVIYNTIDIGVPGLQPLASWDTSELLNTFTIAVIGLALNVRAGILSVDKGQEEAATALGMSWPQTMRRIIVPQSMRIIIPPTGNEVISMLKTTSLVVAVPFSLDLYTRSRDISAVNFNVVPMLLVASSWYLLFTSILMVGQYFLEKRFSRGIGAMRLDKNAPIDESAGVGANTGAVSTRPQTSSEEGGRT